MATGGPIRTNVGCANDQQGRLTALLWGPIGGCASLRQWLKAEKARKSSINR